LKMPASLRNQYESKEARAVVRVQLTVDHKGFIMAATRCFKGTMNDKQIAYYDSFIKEMRTGRYSECKWKYKDATGQDHEETGLYLICDGGYNRWRVLMSADKNWSEPKNFQWAKRLESLRKDVECVNGHLKARFKILQAGIRIHDIAKVGMIVHTCIALHNFLLLEDDRRQNFSGVVEKTREYESSNAALFQELETEYENEELEQQRLKRGDKEEAGFRPLREKLVEHYDYLYRTSEGYVNWPVR